MRTPALSAVLLATAAVLAACSDGPSTTGPVTRGTVAFVLVGPQDDLGYNQAVWEGSLAVERAYPDLEVLRYENVPEDEDAERLMRDLVEVEGADLVFATSFGHLPYAYAVAEDHPEVVVVHQGGTEPEPDLPNFGTYFGSHWEAMYEAGIAAGHATTTGELGFVAAFPIPATHANVNAFTLGARTVLPDATTHLRFTQDWCDPDAQEDLVDELLDAGADVLALHQDCTTRILELAEQAGVGVVGYHADGSEVAATRWLVGAVWTWGDLYVDIVEAVIDGDFATSRFNADFRGSIGDGNNPFTLTEPGPAVGQAARADIDRARRELQEGITPFTGPLLDRDGVLQIEDGASLSVTQIDRLDWWVEGVAGEVPAG